MKPDRSQFCGETGILSEGGREVSSQASIFRIPPIVFRFVADTDIFTHFIYSKNIENQDGQD